MGLKTERYHTGYPPEAVAFVTAECRGRKLTSSLHASPLESYIARKHFKNFSLISHSEPAEVFTNTLWFSGLGGACHALHRIDAGDRLCARMGKVARHVRHGVGACLIYQSGPHHHHHTRYQMLVRRQNLSVAHSGICQHTLPVLGQTLITAR